MRGVGASERECLQEILPFPRHIAVCSVLSFRCNLHCLFWGCCILMPRYKAVFRLEKDAASQDSLVSLRNLGRSERQKWQVPSSVNT